MFLPHSGFSQCKEGGLQFFCEVRRASCNSVKGKILHEEHSQAIEWSIFPFECNSSLCKSNHLPFYMNQKETSTSPKIVENSTIFFTGRCVISSSTTLYSSICAR